MLNLLNLFKKDRLWDFDGGIHPPEMKTQSNGTPLRHLPLPAQFVLPLKQHIGHEGEIGVRPGDQVLRGQPLTFGTGRMLPVHAPTSGTVSKIAPHMTAHPSALAEMCLFILPDGEDRWCEKRPLEDYRSVERSELVARVHQAGVAGLGGAGFPTASKLKGGLHGVNTLIINAAECEPYITADDRLMQDHAAEVLEGSRILAWILQAERVLIGIEDNKPEAIAALKKALGSATDLHIRVIPTKYPSGGAKQLTKILTGKEVPHGGRSTDIGVLMQNVGTAFAVKRAIIDGEPLTERVVTLTGESVAQPGNVWARLGTPISHLLQHAGFIPGAEQMVVMGGPLMGFTLPTLDVPVVKITNCILAPAASEMGQNEAEQGCIRCSACADACPAALLPQQLYWYSRGGDHDKARAHNIADCIECGACAYVCPSNIPLVQYYRQEKAEIQAIDLEAERAALAKNRFEARQQRLECEKAARSAKHQQAKRSVASSDAGAIAAARERVAARQAEGVPPENHADNSLQAAVQAQHEAEVRVHQADLQAANEPVTRQTLDPRKAAVEAAIARTKAKKAAQAAEVSATEAPQQPAPEDEPRKAAVAAAVARTKAKKAAQAAEASATEAPQQSAPEDDPRKAAVAAAVARAKAKKAAQAAEASPTEAPQQSAPEDDPRKAAVAAAVARAKAKKAAKAAEASATEAPQQPAPEDDPRKAAVAAAVARAKAKKAAQAAEASATEAPQQSAPEDDPHKAAVAAAVARAKAKKAARAAEASATEAPQQSAPEHDPRKAAVAAAVARAKAKKAAQAAEASATEAPLQPAPEDDPRKAAIAAAIARAKARKTQQPSMQED